ENSSFTFGNADHRRELAHACAECLGKVDVLRGLTFPPGQRSHEGMEVSVGVGAVSLSRFLCSGQFVTRGVVHDKAKLLLAYITLGPPFAFLRQEYAADQRR